ncbi:hypothetical protein [Microlunatus sp. GCM10028923]|uniref:hypothetical protein n=1 Tax=Microlunatus sp. GCM10028923 TaxID=3273400 RepID=UPI0036225D62
MTETGRPSVSLRCLRLSHVIRWEHFLLDGTEVDQIRDLFCVADDHPGGWSIEFDASPDEAVRWRRATAEIVRATELGWTEQLRAGSRLNPPKNAFRWLAWRWRGGRTEPVRQEVDATVERIRADVRAAYLRFRDQAADLTDRIDAEDRRRREESARQFRERRAARERAIEEVAEAPVWTYQIGPRHGRTGPRKNRLVIALQTLEQPPNPSLGDPVTDLTPAQVNEAIDRLQAEDPYLVVEFAPATGDRLTEWTEQRPLVDQWQRVSGVKIVAHRFTPEELEEISKRATKNTWYGPSSNYSGGPHF